LSYAVWTDQALDNLDTSLELFRAGKWLQSCINAQQSVEMMNKGLLLKAGLPLVRTHDLSQLIIVIEDAGLHHFSAAEKRSAQVMTRTYLGSRYPVAESESAPFRLFSSMDAKDHIQWSLDNLDMLIHTDRSFCSKEQRDEIQSKWNEILSSTKNAN
jgi:HEPN domain-containing protein